MYVKVVESGDNLNVLISDYLGKKGKKIEKVSEHEYVVLSSGEIKHKINNDERDFSGSSVRRTISNLRNIINCNFVGGKNELFITLTYGENMRDFYAVQKDIKLFMQNIRRKLFQKEEFIYIYVLEPQKRGAWHVHMLLKALERKELYVENDKVFEMWKKGFVNVRRLNDCDNVGAYISAYLIKDKNGKKSKLLHLYPKGARIYRASQNVSKPVEFTFNSLNSYYDYMKGKEKERNKKCVKKYEGIKKYEFLNSNGEKKSRIFNYYVYKYI